MAKVAITGATGYLGSRLCAYLTAHGLPYFILPRIKNTSDLVNLLSKSKPDVVFHLATKFIAEHAAEDIEDLIASNVLYGCQLLEAMSRCQIRRLVVTGTGWQRTGDGEKTPANLYAATKNAFDEILKFYSDAYNFNAVRLMLFDTFGPGDKRNKLIPDMIRTALAGERKRHELSGGQQKIDILHSSDIIAGLMAALELTKKPGIQEYRLSSQNPITLKELAEKIATLGNAKFEMVWGAKTYRGREVMKPWQSGPVLPGWKPQYSLEAGLKDVLRVSAN